MHFYAQTNIQLFNQLREGYSAESVVFVRRAYELAMQLFTGQFRPSGKTFLEHLVGTASILVSLQLRVPMVAAGLLHAAYIHGDFGTTQKGISDQKRRTVRIVLGEATEERIAAYTESSWNSKTIREMLSAFDTLNGMDRDVLLLRLANQLEELLDLGILYCPNADSRRKSLRRRIALCVELATKLNAGFLAAELNRLSEQIFSVEIDPNLRNQMNQRRAFLVTPLSCRPFDPPA